MSMASGFNFFARAPPARSKRKGTRSVANLPAASGKRYGRPKGRANLKINVYEACVVYWHQILPTIRRYSKERLTMSQVKDIYDFIDKIKLDTKEKETNREHIRNINKTREKKQKYIAYGKCPRCGRWLVLREGKYGKFYGCSNYPKCKFTQEA